MSAAIDKLASSPDHSRHPMSQLSRVADRVTLNFLMGDLAAAEAGLDQSLAIGEQTEVDPFNFYAPNLLVIRIQQGRVGELVPLLEGAVATQPHHRVTPPHCAQHWLEQDGSSKRGTYSRRSPTMTLRCRTT